MLARKCDVLVWMTLAVAGALPATSSAAPVSGPHETVDSRLTTDRPSAPTGFSYKGVYHAAGDPNGSPPYMRRMRSWSPPGTRYDDAVPAMCTASDFQLATEGPSACPAASRLGGGTSQSAFVGMFTSTLAIDVFNGPDQQIFLAHSPVLATVARGKIDSDNSIEFDSPTCFPSTPLVTHCPVDDVLQLSSSITVPPYTKVEAGRLRSYLTTSPDCPVAGAWQTPIRFWWADGSVDTVIAEQPCRR